MYWRRSWVLLLVAAGARASAQEAEYQIRHAPYLQLGNAVLGAATDRVDILWQTVPAGPGTEDTFSVDYRADGGAWTSAGPVGSLDTGVEGRINHFVSITGLDHDRQYEYRVTHRRGKTIVDAYEDAFRTRLPGGDPRDFTFVAYGDSAGLSTVQNFRAVQDRINQLDASTDVAFSLLLGDNVYNVGSHSEFDARLDPAINPEAAQYIAGHIDYFAMGNHDVGTEGGRPSRENFSVPLNGPAGELHEHNYSFDYGQVHFATFDSNSLYSPARLDGQLDWLVADMQASDAPWKIVFAHHPVAGSPDKPESPADNYYRQVVSRLREAEVDLVMMGHSHTYHWSYPLLGQELGDAVYVLDPDREYLQGAGLVQIVAGTGGRSLRPGDFTQYPFLAAGYSTETDPPMEYGFARVDVTAERLTVSYVAADAGTVIDSFSIVANDVPTILGDMDGDADADFDDIAAFALALEDSRAYESAFGVSAVMKGDTDHDGDFDFDDIPGFVSLLSAGGSQSVPEPSSCVLALAGTACAMCWIVGRGRVLTSCRRRILLDRQPGGIT
jgi:hypothetical protein